MGVTAVCYDTVSENVSQQCVATLCQIMYTTALTHRATEFHSLPTLLLPHLLSIASLAFYCLTCFLLPHLLSLASLAFFCLTCFLLPHLLSLASLAFSCLTCFLLPHYLPLASLPFSCLTSLLLPHFPSLASLYSFGYEYLFYIMFYMPSTLLFFNHLFFFIGFPHFQSRFLVRFFGYFAFMFLLHFKQQCPVYLIYFRLCLLLVGCTFLFSKSCQINLLLINC